MFRKIGVKYAVIISVLLILNSCLTTPAPAPEMVYPLDKPFYPVVYGAFSEFFPNARYLDIDFYNNKYTFTGITGMALSTPISYDLTVRLTQNNQIEFSYNNIYQRDPNGRWEKVNAFGFYNYNNVVNILGTKMLEIANDTSLFQQQENAAMANIRFVHSIMKDFTDLAFKDFINNYAKGSVFSITGRISEVSEVNTTINDVVYKYQVIVSQNFINPSDGYFTAIAGDVRCRFLTNQDSVIRLTKDSELSVQGILVGAYRGLGASISLQLIDAL